MLKMSLWMPPGRAFARLGSEMLRMSLWRPPWGAFASLGSEMLKMRLWRPPGRQLPAWAQKYSE